VTTVIILSDEGRVWWPRRLSAVPRPGQWRNLRKKRQLPVGPQFREPMRVVTVRASGPVHSLLGNVAAAIGIVSTNGAP
jgi:hypothetical protein